MLGAVLGAVVGAVLVVLVLLQFDWVATRAAKAVADGLLPWDGARFRVDHVSLSGIGRLSAHGMRILRRDGSTMLSIDTLTVRAQPLALLARRVSVSSVRAAGVTVNIRQLADSTWDLARPFLPEDSARPPAAFTIRVGRAEIDRLAIEARFASSADSVLRIEGTTLRLRGFESGPPLAFSLDTLDARLTPPTRPEPAHLSARMRLADGRLHVDGLRLVSDSSDVSAHGQLMLPGGHLADADDIDFRFRAAPLDFRDVAALVPGFAVPGSLRFAAHITGSASQLQLDAQGRTFDGASVDLEGTLTLGTKGPVRYALEAKVRDLDASLWGASPARGRLNADAEIDLRGDSLPALNGAARLRASGIVLDGLDLLPTRIDIAFVDGRGQFRIEGAVDPWLDINGEGTIQPFLDRPAYEVDLTLSQRGAIPDSGALMVRNARVRLRADGLGVTRAAAQGSATLTAAADIGQARLRDGRIIAEWGEARGTARLAASFAGGRVDGTATAHWGDGALDVQISRLVGRDVDLAALFGNRVAGRLSLEASGAMPGPRATAVRANARARIDGVAWRHSSLDSVVTSLVLREGRLEVDATAGGPAGAAALHLEARPFAATPTWSIDRLVLRNVNLAGVSNGRVTSDLGGVLALELHGASPSLLTGRGTITLDSSQLRGAPLGPGEFRLDLDSGKLRVEGGLELLRGRMELVGSARPFVATPVFQVERATFREVDVAAISTGQRRLPLSGILGLRGSLPPGSLPDLEGMIELEPSPFNGGRIEQARAEVSLQGGEARVNFDARTGDGSVGLKATAALARTAAVAGESGWALTSARLDGAANLPDLAQLLGMGPVDAGLLAGVHLEGRGADPATMEWTGRLTFSGSWDEARVDSVRLEARISGGRLELDTLLVASNVVDGFGYGSVVLSNAGSAPSDSLQVHLRADTAGAVGRAGIASAVGVRPFGLRSMRLDLLAYNAGQGVQLHAAGGAGGVIVGDAAADSLEVALTAFPRTQGPVELEASLTGRRLAWQRFELESLDARASRDSSGFGFAAEATRDAGHTFEMAGQGRAGERRLRFSRLGFGFGAERWSLADTASVSWGDRVTFADFSLRYGNRRIGLEGSLDRAGVQNLTLTLDSVPIGRFAEFAGLDGLEGTLHGTFGLEGPAERVGFRTDLALALEGLTGRITTEPRGEQLAVDVNLVNPAGNSLRVTGTVPNRFSPGSGDGARRAGEEISLGIRAEAFPVDWLTPFLRPAGVERFEGTIDSDIRLVGTVAQPQASGTARIAAGRITVPRTGLDVRRIDGELALSGRRIQVQRLGAEAGGSMAVEGEVILEPLDNPRFALQARFDEFRPMRTEWIALGLDGRIDVAGDLEHPRLTGSVTLVRTDVFADRVGQGEAVRPVELTARDYAMLESYFGYRRAADVRTSDPLAPWTIDVALAVGGDVWLRKRVRPEMRILLSGSLDVRKQPGDSLQLFGTVRAVPGRSSVEQLGKRFEIEDGSITFNGLASGWRADINARYAVPAFQDPSASEVVITMEVAGGVNDLRLTLGSEPAMETTDVLSYLATGRPAASAAEFGASSGGNGLSGQGASLALGTVAGLLEEQGGDRIGLDVVEIRQGGPDGTTVVAGRYVSPRLYVGFHQPLVERNQGEGIEENGLRTQVEVEFAAFRWLLINLQGGRSELRWFFRTRHAF